MATENTDPNTPPVEQPGGDTPPQRDPAIQAEIDRLANLGRNGDAPKPEFRPQDQGKPQRPEGVPEKFWDADKGAVNQDALLKSYLELEKTRGQPQPPAQEETPEQKAAHEAAEKPPEEPGKEGDKPQANAETSALSSAIETAQTEYATNGGALTTETREALVKAGIPSAQLDLYLEGVKAQERAMQATASEAAGMDVSELLTWAGSGALSVDQVNHLNAGLANPKTLADTVRDLANRYRAANPGEGRLTPIAGTTNFGDVYTSKEQYLADMEKAEKAGDMNARSAAVQKLSRSRKAGTLKEVTPRAGPFRR